VGYSPPKKERKKEIRLRDASKRKQDTRKGESREEMSGGGKPGGGRTHNSISKFSIYARKKLLTRNAAAGPDWPEDDPTLCPPFPSTDSPPTLAAAP